MRTRGCTIPEGEQEKFDSLPAQYSHLYLCIAGELAAVICIYDPLRAEAKDAIRALHACGISKVVMMTGDNRRTAASVAEEVGVDEFYAEVLPEDKAAFIRREKAAGRTVIMIGDGVNDSPALSEADAGVAISTGAAIAREIADITIASEDLFELVTLRKISEALMGRIHRNYRFIVGFNLGLIVFGVAGLLPPTTSALLHNASTLAISLKSMTNLLPDKKEDLSPQASLVVRRTTGEVAFSEKMTEGIGCKVQSALKFVTFASTSVSFADGVPLLALRAISLIGGIGPCAKGGAFWGACGWISIVFLSWRLQFKGKADRIERTFRMWDAAKRKGQIRYGTGLTAVLSGRNARLLRTVWKWSY